MPESGKQTDKTITLKSDFAKSANAHELRSSAMVSNTAQESAASIILSGAQQVVKEDWVSIDKKKKYGEEARFTRSVLDLLNERLAKLDAQIARIDEELLQVNVRRAAIGDQLEALAELEELAASGKLSNNNPTHKAIMKKTGVGADTDPAELAAVIMARRIALGAEDVELESKGNSLIKRRDELSRERDEVLVAKAKIEGATSPEARAMAEESAKAMLDTKKLTDLAVQTDDVNLKILAAETVAKSDGGTDGANADHAKQAAQENTQAVYQSDASSFKF